MQSKRSLIGHGGMPFNCPHTETFVTSLLGSMKLSSNARILDLGCGRGELLRRAMQCSTGAVVGIGVDNNSDMLSKWPDASSIGPLATLLLVNEDLIGWVDAAISNGETDHFDAIFCVGALPAGQQGEMIRKLLTLLKPGGYIVIGELIWATNVVSKEFVDYVGVVEADYCTQTALVAALQQEPVRGMGGCKIHSVDITSLEVYESTLLNNVEAWASANSNDPDAEAIVRASRAWNAFGKRCAWDTWAFCTAVAHKNISNITT